MSMEKEKLLELSQTYFSDDRIKDRVIKRLKEDNISPSDLIQADYYLDSIIYALEQIIIDREQLVFSELKWATFIGNATDNIKVLLHLETI